MGVRLHEEESLVCAWCRHRGRAASSPAYGEERVDLNGRLRNGDEGERED